MTDRLTVVCIACGLEHEETDTWGGNSVGDYGIWHCPDCEEETEHHVEGVEEVSGD